jgi:hypothetical protein
MHGAPLLRPGIRRCRLRAARDVPPMVLFPVPSGFLYVKLTFALAMIMDRNSGLSRRAEMEIGTEYSMRGIVLLRCGTLDCAAFLKHGF